MRCVMKIYAYIFALLIPILLVSCSTTQDKSDDQLADELVSSTFDEAGTDDIEDDSLAEDDFFEGTGDMDIEFTPDEEINVVDIDSDYAPLPGDLDIETAVIETEVEVLPETMSSQPATILSPPSYYSSSRVRFPSGGTGYPDYSSGAGTQGSYVVKRGDSLWAISRRFGTSVQALSRANNISPDGVLKIGKVLVIPSGGGSSYRASGSAGGKTYVVRKGDSYYSIGKKFGVSSQELMAYNGAKSSLLKIGQTIRIP